MAQPKLTATSLNWFLPAGTPPSGASDVILETILFSDGNVTVRIRRDGENINMSLTELEKICEEAKRQARVFSPNKVE